MRNVRFIGKQKRAELTSSALLIEGRPDERRPGGESADTAGKGYTPCFFAFTARMIWGRYSTTKYTARITTARYMYQ